MPLYMIQSNRFENASDASMPLYTILVIFGHSSILVDNQHIMDCTEAKYTIKTRLDIQISKTKHCQRLLHLKIVSLTL